MFDSDPYDEWMETIVSQHLFRPAEPTRAQREARDTIHIIHVWVGTIEEFMMKSDNSSQNKLGANMQCITSAEKIYVHRQAKGAQ